MAMTERRPSSLSVPPMMVPTHGLARWARVKLEIADGVLRWETPVTLLGIVPLGRRHIEVPAVDVTDMRVRRGVRPISLLIGVAAMFLPLMVGWDLWLGVITVPLGLWIVLVALGPRIEAVTATGETHRANVCFGHQIDADLYMAAVEDIATEVRSAQLEDSAS